MKLNIVIFVGLPEADKSVEANPQASLHPP